jgi:hypothetical protein
MASIKAAGKPISQQRAIQIQSIFKTIAGLLIESNSATVDSLKMLLDEMVGIVTEDDTIAAAVASQPSYKSFSNTVDTPQYSGKVMAGSFDDAFFYGWQETLEKVISLFKWKFSDAVNPRTNYYPQNPPLPGQTNPTPESYIKELTDALTLLLSKFPKDMNGELDPEEMMETFDGEELEASSKVAVKASALTLPFINIKANRKLQSGNRMLFEGVLARIDEVSEGIPAVGTGQPLYLPLATAEKIVTQVNASHSLPIDADPSLSKHNDSGIVGVITNATIRGQNLVVTGHLFPFNVPNMVKLLKQNGNRLGMSMNALVSGKTAVQAGKNVFLLEDVDLQGANVLFAEKATYQQSRFTPVAASSRKAVTPNPNAVIPVAASSIKSYPKNNMEDIISNDAIDTLQVQLKQLADIQTATMTQLQASQQLNQDLANRLGALEKERADALAKEQLQLAASAKAAEEKATQEFITAQIKAGLQEFQSGVLNAINPRRAVSQFSATPLVPLAAESAVATQIHPLKAEYDELSAVAKSLEVGGVTGSNRIGVLNKLRDIKIKAEAQGVAL